MRRALVVFVIVVAALACTPAERQRIGADVARCAPAAADGLCFVAEKIAGAGLAGDAACLTLDELAQHVAALEDAGAPVAVVVKRTRKPPRRHCAAWIEVGATDAGPGPADAGGEAGRETVRDGGGD